MTAHRRIVVALRAPALAVKHQEGVLVGRPLFLPKCSEQEANHSGTHKRCHGLFLERSVDERLELLSRVLRLLAVLAHLLCHVRGHFLGPFAGVLEPVGRRISHVALTSCSAFVTVVSFLLGHGVTLGLDVIAASAVAREWRVLPIQYALLSGIEASAPAFIPPLGRSLVHIDGAFIAQNVEGWVR